jgi:hypothetical protein
MGDGMRKAGRRLWAACYVLPLTAIGWTALDAATGPLNVELIPASPTWAKAVSVPEGDWSLSFWSDLSAKQNGTILDLTPDPSAPPVLAIALRDGRPVLESSGRRRVGKPWRKDGAWHHFALVVTRSGSRLYVDGQLDAELPPSTPVRATTLELAPRSTGVNGIGGRFADLRIRPSALSAAELRQEARSAPDADLIQFEQASPHWLLQTRQMQGQVTPQDPATLPQSRTAPDKPVARPLPARSALTPAGGSTWTLGAWTLAEAPALTADGAVISRAGYHAGPWYPATVPGTVLTTLVDRGVYPDPAHGLNNLAIPEKLARQDYWYRTEFDLPAEAAGRRLQLLLNGVNYSAAIWVNGEQVGTTKGAFARGQFDVGSRLRPGRNAIAIRVSPPPHVGHAQEESLTSGVGENGGEMMLDGPTFGASEGWDWIPTIRDRNTGLWQDVRLIASGDVRIGDAQVVTTLPKPDNSVADVEIDVPVTNLSDHPVTASVRAAFDDVSVEKSISLAPGQTGQLRFSPETDPALAVRNPKLWWPNGYGDPALHMLHLTASVGGAASDSKDVRFGMRQVTYEMSLVDQKGALDRVTVDLSRARALGQQIVDERHEAIRQVPGGWTYSFARGAESSPAVTPIKGDEGLSPFLVIRVNGVRIAARGGSIGMDDFMKRVDRARLEPYFRLHKDAHVNVVRNWIGQNTEESFFELADEYGLMVLNDFWESTQDYNIEAEDVPLFLDNAKEVVRRFRNHPSIILWFGRNEGVPQPILNEGLADLIRRDDGTRLYMGSSNRIALHDSGPYNWRPPEKYFTDYSKGFAVEVGTPSFPTLEAWERAIPASERWPISDSWAYHDWHQTGNGAVTSFTGAMDRAFGKPTSLPDFERKAQMLEYDSYRAIFEGMNAGLWTTNSGRMLWMTQPAWPSSAWQIFSSDYDTHGAFYGMKKASEPVHVQMNLPDHKVILVNNRQEPLAGVHVRALVQSLDGRELAKRDAQLDVSPGSTKEAFVLDLDPVMASGPVLVRLEATDGAGTRLSDNFYWQAKDEAALQPLAGMAQVSLTASARQSQDAGERRIDVTISNPAKTAAVQTKLGLFDGDGQQVLPAYFTDNYVSLLPGETRTVTISAPAGSGGRHPVVRLRGWNVAPANLAVEGL